MRQGALPAITRQDPALIGFLIGMALACLISQPAGAQDYSGVYTFGDSLSDDGNIPALTGVRFPPPPYVGGRASNGPTWAEQLPPRLGLADDPDRNVAVSGATTGIGNILNRDGGDGADLFGVAFAFQPGTLPGIRTQVTRFLDGRRTVDRDALYVVWGGANDYQAVEDRLAGLPADRRDAAAGTAVRRTVANLEASVRDLAAKGARRFLVPNLPQTAEEPLRARHNANLAPRMARLGDDLGVSILVLDTEALHKAVRADPQSFSLTNVDDPCLRSLRCLTSRAVQSRTLFWDNVHPTTAAHGILATYAAEALGVPGTATIQGDVAMASSTGFGDVLARRLDARRGGLFGAGPGRPTPEPIQVAQAGGGLEGLGLPATPERLAPDVERPFGLFATGTRSFGERDARAGRPGFDYGTTLVAVGADWRLSDTLVAGAAIGYGTGDADLDGGAGGLDHAAWLVALYGSWSPGPWPGPWYVDAAVSLGVDRYDDIRRRTILGDATADTRGLTASLSLEGGYFWPIGTVRVGPTLGARYTATQVDGYTETGAGSLNRRVDDQSLESVVGSLGLQATTTAALAGATVRPLVRAAWDHAFGDDARTIVTRLADQPAVATRTSVPAPDRNVFRLGGGLSFRMAERVTGLVDYETTLGRDDGQDHVVTGRVRIAF